jgi:hypothetical protein
MWNLVALQWLCKRTKTEDAKIGFHSARILGTEQMSADGNDQTARYLAELGYNKDVQTFGTNSLAYTYLTSSEAKRPGIKMEVVPASIPWSTFSAVNLSKPPDLSKQYKPDPWIAERIIYDDPPWKPERIIPETTAWHHTPTVPGTIVPQSNPPPRDLIAEAIRSAPKVKTVPIPLTAGVKQ